MLFVPRISDLFGRQKLLIGGGIVQSIPFAALVYTHSYAVAVTSLFIMGGLATITTQVGFIYAYENMRVKNYELTTIVLGLSEGFISVFGALYFSYITKNYYPLILTGFVLTLLGTFGVLYYYESPRFLIKSGQITKAQEVLKVIAWRNGADP